MKRLLETEQEMVAGHDQQVAVELLGDFRENPGGASKRTERETERDRERERETDKLTDSHPTDIQITKRARKTDSNNIEFGSVPRPW